MDIKQELLYGKLKFTLESLYVSVDDYVTAAGGHRTPVTFSATLEYVHEAHGIKLEGEAVANSPAAAIEAAAKEVARKLEVLKKGGK